MMVVDALHNIARHSCIKETDREFHQLDKKIGDDGNINPGGEMQQDPASYNLNSHSS